MIHEPHIIRIYEVATVHSSYNGPVAQLQSRNHVAIGPDPACSIQDRLQAWVKEFWSQPGGV